jgi:hypothetical protein
MPVWCFADEAIPASAPAPDRGHVGLGPGLVDEHQPVRINASLMPPPSCSAADNVRPILLLSEGAFF